MNEQRWNMRLSDLARTVMRRVRIWRDQRGAVVVYMAVAAVPVLLAVGVAVDVSRAVYAKNQLSHALDAAALAVGSSLGTGQDPNVVLNNFIAANYPENVATFAAPPTLEIVGDTVKLSAQVEMPTTIMKLAGFDTLTIGAATEVVREQNYMEVALVLDNTGSMRGQKLEDLRAAAHELVNILFGDQTVHNTLKLAVVPYAAAVNVGDDAPNLITQVGQGQYDPSNNQKWKGCVMARPYPNDVLDSPMTGGNKWERYYYPPGWDNQWPPVVEQSWTCYYVRGPNMACPTPIVPLTNTKTTIDAALDDMQVWCGGTFGNLGMAWGWRVLSPDPPFDQGVPYDEPDHTKVLILMTDGINQFGRRIWWSPYLSDYTAYGYLDDGVLGTTNYFAANNVLNDRLAEVCANVKAAGIIVYTITFQLSDPTTQELYRNCASDPSKYFDSPTSNDLHVAFQTIGNELRKLHISK